MRWPVVRLFLLPMLIAGGLVALAIWIGWMTVKPPTLAGALEELRNTSGGERTAAVLVGPDAKQRYLAAQAISLRMREAMEKGMGTAERVRLAESLLDVLEHHTRVGEGEVQHFVLLALGRVWQVDPAKGPDLSAAASASRKRIIEAIAGGGASRRVGYVDVAPPENSAVARRAAAEARKAAVLALGFLAGNPEISRAVPALIRKMNEDEDVDVRIAAASRLGPIAGADEEVAVEALIRALRQADAKNAEVAWNAALSLAQMNRIEARETMLMLLDRKQLAGLPVYDREADPDNPPRRNLTEAEQERFLINAMRAAVKLTNSAAVQAKVRDVAANDPSPRVRSAGERIRGMLP